MINFEKVAALDPDLIIGASGIREVDYDKASEIAPTIPSLRGEADYSSRAVAGDPAPHRHGHWPIAKAEAVIADVEHGLDGMRRPIPSSPVAPPWCPGTTRASTPFEDRPRWSVEASPISASSSPRTSSAPSTPRSAPSRVEAFADLDVIVWLGIPDEVSSPLYDTLAVTQEGRDVYVKSLGDLSARHRVQQRDQPADRDRAARAHAGRGHRRRSDDAGAGQWRRSGPQRHTAAAPTSGLGSTESAPPADPDEERSDGRQERGPDQDDMTGEPGLRQQAAARDDVGDRERRHGRSQDDRTDAGRGDRAGHRELLAFTDIDRHAGQVAEVPGAPHAVATVEGELSPVAGGLRALRVLPAVDHPDAWRPRARAGRARTRTRSTRHPTADPGRLKNPDPDAAGFDAQPSTPTGVVGGTNTRRSLHVVGVRGAGGK